MFVGLPLFQKEGLLASLLIFRLLYFMFPLFFAALLLSLRELRLVAAPVTGGCPRPKTGRNDLLDR